MASPQTENGYIMIANDIWEALCSIRIPGEARQVLDVILRKTYGWKKKEDIISLSQFKKITKLSSIHVIRARNKLLNMNIISVTQKGNKNGLAYSFNKDYDSWIPLPKKVTLPKKVINITQKGNKSLPKKVDTKETIKKTFTKKKLEFFDQEFNSLWKEYHPDGKKNKERSKIRFIALCKRGELEKFKKGYYGYANFLEFKYKKENFKQGIKYFSTLITDYKEYIQYYGHKVEAEL